MEWIKHVFGIGSRDQPTPDSTPVDTQSNRKQQPLLMSTLPGSTRHKDQGLDWYRAGLRHDEDGDEAHGFIVCDEKALSSREAEKR